MFHSVTIETSGTNIAWRQTLEDSRNLIFAYVLHNNIYDDKHILLSGIVCQDETEEIADEHDLDNDADDLDDDDDDVTEDVPEHFADDLEIETKEKEINQVTSWCGKLMDSVFKTLACS